MRRGEDVRWERKKRGEEKRAGRRAEERRGIESRGRRREERRGEKIKGKEERKGDERKGKETKGKVWGKKGDCFDPFQLHYPFNYTIHLQTMIRNTLIRNENSTCSHGDK